MQRISKQIFLACVVGKIIQLFHIIGFEVLTVDIKKSPVFWDVLTCSLFSLDYMALSPRGQDFSNITQVIS